MTDDLMQRLKGHSEIMERDKGKVVRFIDVATCTEAADRIEQLEREKAVVSDLWEQQKQIALDYLADCNEAAEHIEAQAAEIEWLRVETKAQFDRGYYEGCTRAALEARGLEILEKGK